MTTSDGVGANVVEGGSVTAIGMAGIAGCVVETSSRHGIGADTATGSKSGSAFELEAICTSGAGLVTGVTKATSVDTGSAIASRSSSAITTIGMAGVTASVFATLSTHGIGTDTTTGSKAGSVFEMGAMCASDAGLVAGVTKAMSVGTGSAIASRSVSATSGVVREWKNS